MFHGLARSSQFLPFRTSQFSLGIHFAGMKKSPPPNSDLPAGQHVQRNLEAAATPTKLCGPRFLGLLGNQRLAAAIPMIFQSSFSLLATSGEIRRSIFRQIISLRAGLIRGQNRLRHAQRLDVRENLMHPVDAHALLPRVTRQCHCRPRAGCERWVIHHL